MMWEATTLITRTALPILLALVAPPRTVSLLLASHPRFHHSNESPRSPPRDFVYHLCWAFAVTPKFLNNQPTRRHGPAQGAKPALLKGARLAIVSADWEVGSGNHLITEMANYQLLQLQDNSLPQWWYLVSSARIFLSIKNNSAHWISTF